MADEVELKFDVEAGGGAALSACPALADIPEQAEHETVYFDTADLALRHAGYSLRVRRSGARFVQTVKLRSAGSAGLFVRREWESEVPGLAVEPAALRQPALRKLIDAAGGALAPVVRTRFARSRWLLAHKGSRIEVVLDEGEVESGGRTAPISELELELKDGRPADLFALAEAIGAAAPLRLGVLSKAERGFALAQHRLGRPAKAEPVRLAPPINERDAFRIVANACLRHFRLNEIALTAAREPEALHQARVALRRLRSALGLFRPTVRGKTYQMLREELRWLAGRLGAARNLDVLGEGHGGTLPPALEAERAAAYDEALAALASARVRLLMLRLALWIEAGSWRFRERGPRDLAPLAERQLERQWRKVRRQAVRLKRLDPAARHRMRLDVKKLRYSAEFLAGLYGAERPARRSEAFLAALKALQEELGNLNDAAFAAETATRLGAPPPPPVDPAPMLARAEALVRAAEAAAGYWTLKT